MAKTASLEDRLARLKQVQSAGASADGVKELREGLKSAANLVVARAAKIAGEWKAVELQGELVAAFDRLMRDPVKRDKGCSGKEEVAKALDAMGAREEWVYLAGLHHRQDEPSWGGPSDVAGGLRAACARALVNMGYRRAATEVAPLLADSDPNVRMSAAAALAATGADAAEAALRLKAAAGDAEPEVVAECLGGLMRSWPGESAGFVEPFLVDRLMREQVAPAVGQSRRPEALALLRKVIERILVTDERKVYLDAVALLRIEPAVEYLASLVEEGDSRTAVLAIEALKGYRADERLAGRVRKAVAEREDGRVTQAFAEVFG